VNVDRDPNPKRDARRLEDVVGAELRDTLEDRKALDPDAPPELRRKGEPMKAASINPKYLEWLRGREARVVTARKLMEGG
jgi:hypothetical protein